MTPKEKAEELFLKMYNTEDPIGNYPMYFDTAKQCALIAVDEILNLNVLGTILQEWWQQVRNEIEKL